MTLYLSAALLAAFAICFVSTLVLAISILYKALRGAVIKKNIFVLLFTAVATIALAAIISQKRIGDQFLHAYKSEQEQSIDVAVQGSDDLIQCLDSGKSIDECKAVSLNSKTALDRGAEINKKMCFDDSKKFFEVFNDPSISLPQNLDQLITKSCEEVRDAYADVRPALDQLRPLRYMLVQKAWIRDVLLSTVKDLNLDLEMEFLPTATAYSTNEKACSELSPIIQNFSKRGSVQAQYVEFGCAEETCKKTKNDCPKLGKISRTLMARNVPEGFFLASRNEASKEKALAKGLEAEALGVIMPRWGKIIPADHPFRMNRALALSVFKTTVATNSWIINPYLDCAKAVLFNEWVYQGKVYQTKEIDNSAWKKMVQAWADKQSGDYNLNLLQRFACEVVANVEQKEELISQFRFPELSFEGGLDFCRDIRDPKFKDVCQY